MFKIVFKGPSCQDSDGHYDSLEEGELSAFQRLVMVEIYNHTDWHCFVEAVPDNFHEVTIIKTLLSISAL